MGDIEGAFASSNYETQVSDVSGAVHTGRGGIIHVERVELAAMRAADVLRRVLSSDEKARDQLLEVLEQLSALQAQLGEWKELHHILHEVLAAFSPFYTHLRTLSHTEARPTDGRALLRGWWPCQTQVDRLVDFESSVEYIRPSPRPHWGARIASLRHEVEDRLREERWSSEGLMDLAEEFNQACDCYLSLADRELCRVAEKVQRLYALMLGGLR